MSTMDEFHVTVAAMIFDVNKLNHMRFETSSLFKLKHSNGEIVYFRHQRNTDKNLRTFLMETRYSVTQLKSA